MKRCPMCGTENPDSSKFCSECGFSLAEVKSEDDASREEINTGQDTSDSGNKEEVQGTLTDSSTDSLDQESQSAGVQPLKKHISKKTGGIIVAAVAAVIVLVIAVTTMQGQKAVSISSTYDGATEAGTVLDENNDGIEVTAKLKNGSTKKVSGWTVKNSETLEADSTSEVTINYNKLSCTLNVKCTTPKMESINAVYQGDTDEGVTLDENNKGIVVTAVYSDDSSEELDDWKIESPVTLQKGQTSSVEITYGDFQTTLDVNCTTPLELTSISAEYDGDTEEGTVLDNSNTGIHVTGTYEDGSTDSITDWTIASPVTLSADQDATVTITSGNLSCDLTVHCTTESPDTFKASCQNIAYDDVARNPDNYITQRLHIYGQVIQVQDQGSDVILRIATKDSGYGNYYDDVYLVQYTYKDGDPRLLEDDMVDVYGYCAGSYTYTSVLGASVTVPSMLASYIDIK